MSKRLQRLQVYTNNKHILQVRPMKKEQQINGNKSKRIKWSQELSKKSKNKCLSLYLKWINTALLLLGDGNTAGNKENAKSKKWEREATLKDWYIQSDGHNKKQTRIFIFIFY
jgi:beta-lactamase superfamily II metal-dependent hydrolase